MYEVKFIGKEKNINEENKHKILEVTCLIKEDSFSFNFSELLKEFIK